jgi:hypothetical protein
MDKEIANRNILSVKITSIISREIKRRLKAVGYSNTHARVAAKRLFHDFRNYIGLFNLG